MNIIVTGSSKGIGFETTLQLCKAGHNILAVSRNNEKLKALKMRCLDENVPGTIFLLDYDLTCDKLEMEFNGKVGDFFSNVDILINNAGALVNKPLEELTNEDFDQIFDINVKSVFRLVKTILPLMNKNSHIINIGSMGGFQGSAKFGGLSLYSASKGALAIFTECLAEELKNKGIKVNCLALGAAQTEMLAKAFPGYEAPLKATEIAEYIAEFALGAHKYINGKIIPVSLSTP